MQYKEIIPIDKITSLAIANNLDEKIALFERLLLKEKDTIINVLNSYNYFDSTTGRVHNFKIKDGSVYLDNSTTGGFCAVYQVHYHFGCDDVHSVHNQQMRMSVSFDFKNNQAEIAGEFWKEREPEEF